LKPGRASLTAVYVAFARACASYDAELSRLCRDPAAELLLPAPLRALVVLAKRDGGEVLRRGLRHSALGMFEYMALRTHIIDEATSQAVGAGARQLVLLGAGLDARAHRLAQLRDVTVFEIDHPSTQSVKRQKARALPLCAKELRYAACDFERVTLADALRSTSFDVHQPSVWIWEGVTMYLHRAAVDATLETVAQLSTPGSRLICTYLTPRTSFPAKWFAAAGEGSLGLIGEPIRTHFTPSGIATLLQSHALSVVSDVRPGALAAELQVSLPIFSPGIPAERIVTADKRATRSA
jgi:methyltransferase (TIGR00027 family)